MSEKEQAIALYEQMDEDGQQTMLRVVILLAYGSEERKAAFEAIVNPVLDGVQDTGGKPKIDFFKAALDAVGA